MKKLTSLFVLFSGVTATLLLAFGFDQAAQKMDPVSQKSLPISSMQTGEIAALPCAPCTTGGGSGGGTGGGSGGGGFTDGSDRPFHA